MASQKDRAALAKAVTKTTKKPTAASLQKKTNTLQASYLKSAKTTYTKGQASQQAAYDEGPSQAKKAKYSHTVTLRADKMAAFQRAWDAAGSKEEKQALISSVQDQERDVKFKKGLSDKYDKREAGVQAKNQAYDEKNRALYKETGKAIDREKVSKAKAEAGSWQNRGKSILGKAFEVIDTPRAAVLSAGHELGNEIARDTGGTVTYKGKKEKGGFSLKDFVSQTFDPKKRLYGSDVIEGMGVHNKIAKGIAGFGVDVAADPLSYVGGVGIARHGAQAVGEEVATNLAKKVAIKAEENAAQHIGADAAKELFKNEATRGKLVENALKNVPEVADYQARGAKVAAEASRTGVSKLSRADIAEFLTRPGETTPRAARGVGFAGKAIPGTDTGPLAKLGELKAEVAAKTGKAFRERGGRILEGHAAEMAAIKSGDPSRALDAINARLTRGVTDSRAEAAARLVGKQYQKATKDFSSEDKALLVHAIEGDVKAQAELGGRHVATKELLDTLVEEAQKAGVNIRKTEDYFPRQITEEAKAALDKEGIDYRQGGRGRRAFEKARTLTPGESHTFLGETVMEPTAAAVRKRVDAIAQDKLGSEVAHFFSGDADKVMNSYIRGITRRTAEAQGARELYARGFGITASHTFEDLTPEAKTLRDSLMHSRNMTAEEATKLAARADQQEGAVRQLQSHLLSIRANQLEQVAAGQAPDEPLSDSVRKLLADSINRGAGEDVTALEARVTRLQANDAQRAVRRGNRATMLDQEISDLRSQLDEAHQMSGPERAARMANIDSKLKQVENLENSKAVYQDRLDTILGEATRGERQGVVLPEGWQMTEIPGGVNGPEMLPKGTWKEVTPEHAFLDAGATAEHATEVARKRAKLDMLVEDANAIKFPTGLEDRAGPIQELHQVITDLLYVMNPKMNKQEIINETEKYFVKLNDEVGRGGAGSYVMNVGKGEGQFDRVHALFHRLDDALRKEEKDMQKRLERAAGFAERNPDTGLVNGPLYHGSPHGLPESGMADRIDTAEHVYGNADKGGAYLTDDQTGQVVGGRLLDRTGQNRGGYMNSAFGESETPFGFTFAPTDPDIRLLPVGGDSFADSERSFVHPEDLSPQTQEAYHAFYQGLDPELDDVHHLFEGLTPRDPRFASLEANLGTTDPLADDLAQIAEYNPVQAFLMHDALTWMESRGMAPESMAHFSFLAGDDFSGLYDEVAEAANSAAKGVNVNVAGEQVSDAAATLVNDYRDHLYDDLGIKGLQRNPETWGVAHNHHIFFRPSEDLQMIGKTDYSAAVAQRHIALIENRQKSLTFTADKLRKGLEAEDESVAKLHEAYDTAVAKRSKYAKVDPGAVKPSLKTQRATEALQAAIDQADAARVHAADTADVIAEKVKAAGEQAGEIRQWLNSDSPITPKMRQQLEQLHSALSDSVKWGNAHQRSLELGDTQLTRLSAMERAAADTRAQLADLHIKDQEMGRALGNLPKERYKELSEEFKKGLHVEIAEGIGTPQEIADMLQHVEQRITPENLHGLMKTYDNVVNWLKAWQIATPGFIERNIMGGIWNNGFEDVHANTYLDYIKARAAALRSARGNTEAWDRYALKNPEGADLYTRIQTIVGEGNVGHDVGLAGRPRNKVPNPVSRNNLYIRGMTHANEEAENFLRGSLAMQKLREGETLDQAVAAINRVHFDYGDLSHAEQGIKKVIPFYTWSRKNIPLQFQQLLTNPKQFNRYGVFAAEVERASNPDATTPSYFPETGATRLPFTKGGGHLYSALDLPFRDLQTPLQNPKEALLDVASMVTPVLKTPIEYAIGRQAFKGLDLTDKPVPIPVPAVVIKGIGPALEATGLAQRAGDGSLVMSQKNAYVLEQFAPMLARYRRMSGQGGDKQLGSVLSTLFGVNVTTNTKDQQAAATYYDNQAVIAKLKTQLQRDIIGQSPARIKKLYADFNRTINSLTQGK